MYLNTADQIIDLRGDRSIPHSYFILRGFLDFVELILWCIATLVMGFGGFQISRLGNFWMQKYLESQKEIKFFNPIFTYFYNLQFLKERLKKVFEEYSGLLKIFEQSKLQNMLHHKYRLYRPNF